jgi:5-methylcytosine-specific restriction endonuclease McrA
MSVVAAVLGQPALVLNRNWQPIRTASVQEVVGLVAKGSAKIIDPEDYQTHDLLSWNDVSKAKAKYEQALIRSSRLSLVPPEVVLLTEYAGIGERGVVFSRRNIFKRDKYTCQFCGTQPGPSELTIDHVFPKSRGGKSTWENCVLACIDCNKTKANRTPEEARMTLRKVPKKPTWRVLAKVAPRVRKQSWAKFLDTAYWDVKLEP